MYHSTTGFENIISPRNRQFNYALYTESQGTFLAKGTNRFWKEWRTDDQTGGKQTLAAGGGAAFYFLVLKPKQKTKVPSDLDDLDLEDEELEDEEYLKDDEDETEDTK